MLQPVSIKNVQEENSLDGDDSGIIDQDHQYYKNLLAEKDKEISKLQKMLDRDQKRKSRVTHRILDQPTVTHSSVSGNNFKQNRSVSNMSQAYSATDFSNLNSPVRKSDGNYQLSNAGDFSIAPLNMIEDSDDYLHHLHHVYGKKTD